MRATQIKTMTGLQCVYVWQHFHGIKPKSEHSFLDDAKIDFSSAIHILLNKQEKEKNENSGSLIWLLFSIWEKRALVFSFVSSIFPFFGSHLAKFQMKWLVQFLFVSIPCEELRRKNWKFIVNSVSSYKEHIELSRLCMQNGKLKQIYDVEKNGKFTV